MTKLAPRLAGTGKKYPNLRLQDIGCVGRENTKVLKYISLTLIGYGYDEYEELVNGFHD